MKSWLIVPLAILSLTCLVAAEPLALTVHTDQTTKTISTGIYGQFLEHIFNSVHGGLWGDQILNGTLELRPAFGRRGMRRGPAPADASAAAMTAASATAPAATPPAAAPAAAPTTTPPRNWEFVGEVNEVTMSCPALFLRKQGVTRDWDNALINFDQKSWFPAANYVVMKLWRDCFAPHLLAMEGPEHPLNFVATRSADKQTVFLKAVNPTSSAVEAAVRLDGDLVPKAAAMQMVAPGGDAVKNTLEQPDRIQVVAATATVENRTVRFTMPPLSAGVVRVTP